MVEEATRLGVALRVVEAGGYPNLERQIAQITECARDADVLALGAVSFDGLTEAVLAISEKIPVIAVVNDIADPGISAKAAVSWVTMGEVTGAYLASLHPAGTPPVKVAWFPGPRESQWAHFVEEGFTEALAGSAVDIVVKKWGDTGREIQLILVEEALEDRPDVDYIVGSAVTAGAAVSLLRARGLTGRIRVLADYFTHAVYRGIKRDRIVAAPTDFPALQGRMGIEMAVRLLEGKLEHPTRGAPDPHRREGQSRRLQHALPFRSGRLAPADFSPIRGVEVPLHDGNGCSTFARIDALRFSAASSATPSPSSRRRPGFIATRHSTPPPLGGSPQIPPGTLRRADRGPQAMMDDRACRTRPSTSPSMPEVQDGGLVGQRLRQAQPHETPHRLHLVEKVLHPRVAQVVAYSFGSGDEVLFCVKFRKGGPGLLRSPATTCATAHSWTRRGQGLPGRRLQRRRLQLRLRRRGAVLRQRRARAPLRLCARRPFLAR